MCPSASTVNRTADDNDSASATDQSYGVAGSPVFPITRIGAAPSAGPNTNGSIAVGDAEAARAGAQEVVEPHRSGGRLLRPGALRVGIRTFRVVGTVDEQVRLELVGVGAVGLASGLVVAEHLQQRAVLVGFGDVQRLGEERPGVLAVERSGDAELQLARREHPVGVVGGEAAEFGDLLDERCVHLERRADLAQHAVLVGIAGGGEVLQRAVEASTLFAVEFGEIGRSASRHRRAPAP